MSTTGVSFGELLEEGIPVPTFQNSDRVEYATFRVLKDFLDEVARGAEVDEHELQAAVLSLAPTLPISRSAECRIRMLFSTDLDHTVPHFDSHPVPAPLIRWRKEVTRIRSAAQAREAHGSQPPDPAAEEPCFDEAVSASSSAAGSKRLSPSVARDGAPSRVRKRSAPSDVSSSAGARSPDGLIKVCRPGKPDLIVLAFKLEVYRAVRPHG